MGSCNSSGMAHSKVDKMINNYARMFHNATIIFVLGNLTAFAAGKYCPGEVVVNNKTVIIADIQDKDEMYSSLLYHCPLSSDPEYYTECCKTEDHICCPRVLHFYEFQTWLAMVIALTVTLSCVTLTIITVVCCFWSRCSLHSLCVKEYTSVIPMTILKGEGHSNSTSKKSKKANTVQVFPTVVQSNSTRPLEDAEAV
ncbi:uncharacterized protein LOC111087980 [Limulus polyphemus]|uniref:Uncharacterized protein LOC111087980 n=1 Tax=Limulus polyphemus TaxID=6850 RepID=A0ABM1T8T7_LIMPO|nr:uncharacterized protein LOC111087980 [Limulus polyphemus]